eukprot:COSAG01_NODE_13977_length_1512_cov_0.785563_1_plen_395_part_10
MNTLVKGEEAVACTAEPRPSRGWCCRKRAVAYSPGARRVVRTNVPDPVLPSNQITNTRYTLWTFLPMNLMEQFDQHINRYFLLIACMQLIDEITPVHPITTWAPLIVIFGISGALSANDDLKRRKRDIEFNTRGVQRLAAGGGGFEEVRSQDICVGDILRVSQNEEIPCDMVLLQTSDPKGSAYVMTANLDGETDYKLKNAVPSTQGLSPAELDALRATVVCLPPNADIHKFDSYFVHDAGHSAVNNGTDLAEMEARPGQDKTPLSISNVMWQATHLKTAEWAVGLAVYTGMQTRVGCNRKPAEVKLAQSDRFLNRSAVCIFCWQLLLVCTFGAYGSALNVSGEGTKHYYLGWDVEEAAGLYAPLYPVLWLGPNGTRTGLHADIEFFNLLGQVRA